MKRMMMLPVAALIICMALPQFSQATTVKTEVAAFQEKEVKYTEIEVDKLPQEVSKALAKDYVGFTTEKAYKGDDGSFKLKVTKGDEKSVLFYSATGEFIKSEKATDKGISE